MGRLSPEPLGDAEWGRWPFYNPPVPSRGPSNLRPRPLERRPRVGATGRELWLRLSVRRSWAGGGDRGPHVALDSRDAGSSPGAGACGGRERPEGGGTRASTSRSTRSASGG